MIARQQQLAAGGRKSQSERAAQERVERKRKSCDAGSAAGAENWYKSSSTRAGRIVALENCLETAPLRSAQLSSVSRYRICAAAAAGDKGLKGPRGQGGGGGVLAGLSNASGAIFYFY